MCQKVGRRPKPRSARRAPPKPASRPGAVHTPARATREARRRGRGAPPRRTVGDARRVRRTGAEPTEPVAPGGARGAGAALVTPQEAVASTSQGGAVPPDEPGCRMCSAPRRSAVACRRRRRRRSRATRRWRTIPWHPHPTSVPGPAVLGAGPPGSDEAPVGASPTGYPAAGPGRRGGRHPPRRRPGRPRPRTRLKPRTFPRPLRRPSPASPVGSGNVNVSIRIFSPGDDGPVTQIAQGGAPVRPRPPPPRRPRRGSGTGPGTAPRAATRAPPATPRPRSASPTGPGTGSGPARGAARRCRAATRCPASSCPTSPHCRAWRAAEPRGRRRHAPGSPGGLLPGLDALPERSRRSRVPRAPAPRRRTPVRSGSRKTGPLPGARRRRCRPRPSWVVGEAPARVPRHRLGRAGRPRVRREARRAAVPPP